MLEKKINEKEGKWKEIRKQHEGEKIYLKKLYKERKVKYVRRKNINEKEKERK